MRKLLFIFSIAFITCAFAAHGVLAYQFASAVAISAEEDNHEEGGKPTSKGDSKDIMYSNFLLRVHYFSFNNTRSDSDQEDYHKGFLDCPYNPPDLS